jgi:hypothetical protein
MAKYSPMAFMSGLTGIEGSYGAKGAVWESKKKGLDRRSIQAYLNRMATGAMKAGRGMGLADIFGKGVGLLSMAMGVPPVIGGAISGAVSGLGQKMHADKLSREKAPDVLYGLEAKEKAESEAHSAIDQLIGSVAPRALTTAITTPLTYMSMQNIYSGIPDKGGRMAGGVQSALNPLSQEAVDEGAKYGLNYAQRAQMAKTGGFTYPVEATNKSSFWDMLFK